jgi:hypothetical protein
MPRLSSGRTLFPLLRLAPSRPGTLPRLRDTASDFCSTPVTNPDAASSLAAESVEAFALGFRTTRFLAGLAWVAVLVLALVGILDFLVVLLLRAFSLAGLAFRRGVFGLLRVTRGTVRAAVFTAFARRGLFVLIPGSDPCGGSRIHSDTSTIGRQLGGCNVNLPRSTCEERTHGPPCLTILPPALWAPESGHTGRRRAPA